MGYEFGRNHTQPTTIYAYIAQLFVPCNPQPKERDTVWQRNLRAATSSYLLADTLLAGSAQLEMGIAS